MKTYEVRHNNACPNGLHPDYNPALDAALNECTCPWLVVSSNTPIQHLTSWNRRELENLIREMDGGYFDPPTTPLRKNSMFLSPTLQRLLDVAEKDPAAAALSLLAGAAMHGDSGLPPFDAIAWDAEDACLSLRSGAAGGWRRLWLGHANVEAVTDHDAFKAGGASPVALWVDHPDTATEVGLPVIGPFSVAFPVPAADYFAEDIDRKIREQADEIAAETGAEGVLVIPDEVNFPSEVSAANVIAMAQDAHDVAASSFTAKFMADLRTSEAATGDGGTPLADEVAGLLARLPRRTRQQPSQIAQAGAGDYCTCDLNRSYTCPPCRSAAAGAGDRCSCDLNTRQVCDRCQGVDPANRAPDVVAEDPSDLADNQCTCAYRGSAPDTYRCRAHPSSGSTDSRLSAEGVTFLPPEEPPAALV